MDKPTSEQEQPEEQTTTPAEVWDQLSPEIQSQVSNLLAEMAYKYVLAQRELLSDEPEDDVDADAKSERHCPDK